MNGSVGNELKKVGLVLGIVFLTVAILAGCAGNNPSGPQNAGAGITGTGAATTSTTSVSRGTSRILGKVVNSSQGAGGTTMGGLTVSLINDKGTTLANYVTETTGEFFFNDVKEGIYVLRVVESNEYTSGAAVVEVLSGATTQAPNISVVSKNTITSIPTVDLCGTLTAALDNSALSVAQLTLDTGQTAVTNALGYFYFPYVASGNRTIFINKNGLAASLSIALTVEGSNGQAIANVVRYNGATFTPVINNEPLASGTDSFGKTRLVKLGVISLGYTLHPSAIFVGTVLQLNASRTEWIPTPRFEFELWVQTSDSPPRFQKFQTVLTDDNGTWKVDNVPPYTDNSWKFLAAASGSQPIPKYTPNGDLDHYDLKTQFSPFSAFEPFTNAGYVAEAGKTTVMDIHLPCASSVPIFTVNGPVSR